MLARSTLEARLEAARMRFPVGTPVIYHAVMGFSSKLETVVRSTPWALGHGDIVVKVEGITGGVSVDHLSLQDGAQAMASRHPATNIGE